MWETNRLEKDAGNCSAFAESKNPFPYLAIDCNEAKALDQDTTQTRLLSFSIDAEGAQ